MNLLQNAIDAIAEANGGPREIVVRVRTRQRKVEVAVIDSGVGISARVGEHLFEPFFTTKPRGLGMGLAISRSIIEAHRGAVRVEESRAETRRGATIYVTLPMLQAPRAKQKRPAEKVQRGGA